MIRQRFLWSACALAVALPVFAAAADAPAGPGADQGDVQRRLTDAQQRLDAAAREVAELSGQLGRRFEMRLGRRPGEGGSPPRALLGVGLSSGDHKDGAHVENVSPGGPAAEAGIKAGDVITSIGGFDLTKDSNPGRALVEKMREIDPSVKVQLGVLRAGKKISVDVTPRPAPMMIVGGPTGAGNVMVPPPPGAAAGPGMRTFQLRRGPDGDRGPGEFRDFVREMDGGTRFRGMEFATLSERLGSYFGVKSGVLVVRAGASSPFKLQDGDVILAIDGREATSAQHASRILRSYQPGEKLTLKVQRDRKSQNIEVAAPGGRDED